MVWEQPGLWSKHKSLNLIIVMCFTSSSKDRSYIWKTEQNWIEVTFYIQFRPLDYFKKYIISSRDTFVTNKVQIERCRFTATSNHGCNCFRVNYGSLWYEPVNYITKQMDQFDNMPGRKPSKHRIYSTVWYRWQLTIRKLILHQKRYIYNISRRMTGCLNGPLLMFPAR